jgi:hypothetical protein
MAACRDLDEAAFLSKYKHPFLVTEGNETTGNVRAHGGQESTKRYSAGVVESATPVPAEDSPFVISVDRLNGAKQTTLVTVGRGEDCDIRVVHPLVSKHHAYFKQDGDLWLLADAGSTNGTFADGVRLEPHKVHKLATGESQAIRFGPAMRYRYFAARAFFEYVSLRARMKPGAVNG